MVLIHVLTCIVLCLALSTAIAQPGAPGALMAQPKLVAERDAVVPGETVTVGLHFTMQPGWHIYWQGLNDTGFPVEVTWETPPGVTVGELQWPAPRRYVSPGEILDYVYEGEVTLLADVSVDASVSPGAEITLAAEASWLVCREACIPEDARLQRTFRIAGSLGDTGPGDGFRAIERARSRLPLLLPTEQRDITMRWSGTTLEITPVGGFAWAAFYPHEDSAAIVDPIRSARVERGTLRLRMDTDGPVESRTYRGILEIMRGSDRASTLFWIETAPAKAAKAMSNEPMDSASALP